jgi:chromosome partitioning protein
MKTVAFFNNKGGVGKTSLVYHLAWMFAELGHNIVVADLDPQANLTSMFLPEDTIETLSDSDQFRTIYKVLSPIIRGLGDIAEPNLINIPDPRPIPFGVGNKISLIPGDLNLSLFEDKLSLAWNAASNDERAQRENTAFYRTIFKAAELASADYAFIDVGPNLGAINRAALVSSDYVVVPLGADLFSLQGLRNMGPALKRWSHEWKNKIKDNPFPDLLMPKANIQPLGYILMRHSVRESRPVQSYAKWIQKMPEEYKKSILESPPSTAGNDAAVDCNCLAILKDYRSLMPMAQEARKPMFLLKSADGAIGAHQAGVSQCYQDFEALAKKLIDLIELN